MARKKKDFMFSEKNLEYIEEIKEKMILNILVKL